MARSELDIFPSKRHDKLEFFLKRHLEESVFNKIRMYEACIVVSERKSKKAFEYVILTDECIYLTQNPPKTIHEAVHLNDVVAIELVDDYPDFLSGQDRESAQHIRIVSITRAEKKGHKVQVRGNKYLPAVISGRRKFGALSQEEAVVSSNIQEGSSISKSKQGRALNQFSLSSEETNKLFNQLSSELLHGNNFLERSFSLVQELKMAALRNFTIKKLFWKSNDLYPFLISKLQEHLPKFENPISQQDKRKMAGHLQFSILIVETLGVMFRETETEPTRLTLLNANRGMTVMNLLKILISGPQIPTPAGTNVPTVSEISTNSQDGELQKLLLEYNNAVTTVVYEIFLITHQGNWGSASGNLTVGWLMVALKKLPSMLPFIDQMMKHIIKMVLPPIHIMSPTQALQLFQQFYILNTCIQYSSDLAEHIRNKYSEEFRYYIQTATVEAMLPVHYAVAQPTIRLLRQVLSFVLHKLI
ncbi:uncharacterized protein C12orf56 homolog isoform X2 [Chiloscyllium plagiosum]|uniref:uncharacterized protein C12orf56 homolog isoform X2 n=1 Tax=Chiloscyllium plagiosum TaxID=36176 RepID=UPI001CB842ED|nr:uncharacterized protein C12orf56 homolog isoform X2 [Chiloscyllium plagiosum]